MTGDVSLSYVRDAVRWDREYREREGLRMFGERCWYRTPNGWASYDPAWRIQERIDEVEAREEEAYRNENQCE